MNTPIKEIQYTLYKRLLDALPIEGVEARQISWANKEFTAKEDEIYLQPDILYGETTQASLGPNGFECLLGVFQINVVGVFGEGELDLNVISQALIDLYRAGTHLTTREDGQILITNCYRSPLFLGRRAGLLSEGDRPMVTVTANWQFYVQRGE